ncbi:MAG: EcsC family protein [Peptococcus niger]|nr:EcsC family protein [Peptococcus niger]
MPKTKKILDKSLDKLSGGKNKLTTEVAPKLSKTINDAAKKASDSVAEGTHKLADKGSETKEVIVNQLDANHDGHVDIEDIITLGMKVPGVRINREDFLRKELKLHYDTQIIDQAIATTPSAAGISPAELDDIAEAVIQRERYHVSGISAALGTPGGISAVATIPTDIIQFYGYMLRTAQELMYLYGFPDLLQDNEETDLDSSTMNILIIALGVMYGVSGASNAIRAMAKALGNGVQKQLMKKALTKGTIYPIVKGVSKWFGVRMTKEVFSGFFQKTIPVLGGVLGGGITYATFKLCCDKLKVSLKNTKLVNPDYQESTEEAEVYDAIITEIKDENDHLICEN